MYDRKQFLVFMIENLSHTEISQDGYDREY